MREVILQIRNFKAKLINERKKVLAKDYELIKMD